jgi:hypothetical protein
MKNNWPLITATMNHRKKVWRVDARFTPVRGKRRGERKFFNSKEEAKDYADRTRALMKKEGMAAFYNSELEAFGYTVQDALRFALEHLRKRGGNVQPVANDL